MKTQYKHKRFIDEEDFEQMSRVKIALKKIEDKIKSLADRFKQLSASEKLIYVCAKLVQICAIARTARDLTDPKLREAYQKFNFWKRQIVKLDLDKTPPGIDENHPYNKNKQKLIAVGVKTIINLLTLFVAKFAGDSIMRKDAYYRIMRDSIRRRRIADARLRRSVRRINDGAIDAMCQKVKALIEKAKSAIKSKIPEHPELKKTWIKLQKIDAIVAQIGGAGIGTAAIALLAQEAMELKSLSAALKKSGFNLLAIMLMSIASILAGIIKLKKINKLEAEMNESNNAR